MNWDYIAGYFDGEGTAWAGPRGKWPAKVSLHWYNTHLGSLEAMQAFMGCGQIVHRKKNQPHYKQAYELIISRRADVMRVTTELLPRCIIKADAIRAVERVAATMTDQCPNWGNLATVGTEEVRRLYWEEVATPSEMAARFGVTAN